MARDITFPICGISIVTHPHSPEGYVRLMRAVFNKRMSVAVRGHQRLMIGALMSIHRGDPERGLKGSFYRFIQIDRNAPWFNVSRHDEATDEELSLINIPDDLRPNTETYDFIFYPHGHTLYFNRRSGTKINNRRPTIGPSQVAKLLVDLFSMPQIQREFGEVAITVLPDSEQLDLILAIPKLRRLVIDVVKPNPDELGQAQARVFGRMRRMHARRLREEITSERDESVVLDDETRMLANVAATSGMVEGHGYTSSDSKVDISTVEKPWSEVVSYNPGVQTEFDALAQATANLPGHGL